MDLHDEPARGNTDLKSEREREEEIERWAAQTGRLIREADRDSRAELADAAAAILREEALSGAPLSAGAPAPQPGHQQPLNPLSAGIGLLLLGAALALLLPFLGLAISVIGALAVLWGLVITWSRTDTPQNSKRGGAASASKSSKDLR